MCSVDIEKKTAQLAEAGLDMASIPSAAPRPESNGNGAGMGGGEYEEEFSNPLQAGKQGMMLGDNSSVHEM